MLSLKSIYQRCKYSVGKMMRDTGMELERRGCYKTKDISYMEPLSRHRNVMGLYDSYPAFNDSSFVSSSSTLIGNVTLGENSQTWYGSILRADLAPIRVGNNSIIGDNTVINTVMSLPTGVPTSVNIGNNVEIEHNCTLTSCLIDDNVTVGFKSIVSEGAVLERGCVIGSNSYVPPARLIPSYQLWEGSPVQFIRDLSKQEIQQIQQQKEKYIENTQQHKELNLIEQ